MGLCGESARVHGGHITPDHMGPCSTGSRTAVNPLTSSSSAPVPSALSGPRMWMVIGLQIPHIPANSTSCADQRHTDKDGGRGDSSITLKETTCNIHLIPKIAKLSSCCLRVGVQTLNHHNSATVPLSALLMCLLIKNQPKPQNVNATTPQPNVFKWSRMLLR